jgi:4-phosphopantoate--beta-alanine ligase
MIEIPDDHPRAESLKTRHKIIDGMHKKIVAEAGLIAHGRGEAFDYLIGEKTHDFAMKAIKAAAAMFYLADHPIISVNGNVAVLCPEEMVRFSKEANIAMEINLFYRSEGRIEAIKRELDKFEPNLILGIDKEYSREIDEISSLRRVVDERGIYSADVVFVPLEDGDRTMGLKKNNKKIITVDLNPMSRTSINADITIVDNIIRVFPILEKEFLAINSRDQASDILENYDNDSVLKSALNVISTYWNKS